MNLTVLLIAKNAERTLRRTLLSIEEFNCEILLINDYSIDKTTRIAREFGAHIISHHEDNFGKQRAFALSEVQTKWTLVIDTDEVLTKENRDEVKEAIKREIYNGYYLRFRNHLFGKKLKHGELHKKMVLFKTKKASVTSHEVHEHFQLNEGMPGELPSEVLHFSYQSVGQIIWKFFTYYTVRLAKQNKKKGIRPGWKELILYPLHMFYARFIKDEGYKDGIGRLFLDFQFAYMEFLSYFLIPFVHVKQRVSIDCGGYAVGSRVQSGIERLLQGIYTHKSCDYEYYWYSFSPSSERPVPKRFFSQFWLPMRTLIDRCDIFLGTSGTIPWILSFFPIQKILFLYDFGFFIHPEKYGERVKILQQQTNFSIKASDNIIFLHREIYKEFIERYPQFTHKASVISSGADHLTLVEEKPVFIQPKKPMVLYVGVVKPIKQIEKLISIVGDTYTIIAGPQVDEYKKSLIIGKTQNIQFIKNINDGQLKWLYTHADVMVYTSAQEGFCYPVLEALSLGLPVIAFDLPIFQEYKMHFPHLLLVKDEEELKRVLHSKIERLALSLPKGQKSNILQKEHSYQWKTFSEQISALWQPAGLPRLSNNKYAFIVVLYKTPREEKARLEKEILAIGLSSFEIYWVDNSINGIGYAGGINEGIRRGLIDGCEEFIALNPDISLNGISADTIATVSAEFDVWGFAMEQNGKKYYGGELDRWRMSGGLMQSKPNMKFAEVDFVSGSVIGFSKDVIQKIGLWDESYFMYYEDVDYCVRAKRAGFQIGIDTQSTYTHFEVSQLNDKKNAWLAKSRLKFFLKYSSLSQKLYEIIRLPKELALFLGTINKNI